MDLVEMRSHQAKVAALVPGIVLDHFGPRNKVFKITKTIQLIIRYQYCHLVVMAPHCQVSVSCSKQSQLSNIKNVL